MSNSFSVVIWSKKGCHYCTEVKEYLNSHNIAYQDIDVTNADDRRDILDIKYGVRHVPVVEIGNGEVYKAVKKVGIQYVQESIDHIKKEDSLLS
ncbi:glutaredoxin family protein [Priestia endophytica]|uniref:glutaredoxin family protein n=1 Tax=Priestia endophytica TaxID=135735 RepID=UPI002E1A8A65|nr:glutaredoxin [Priestia endophytica]